MEMEKERWSKICLRKDITIVNRNPKKWEKEFKKAMDGGGSYFLFTNSFVHFFK